VQVCSVDLRTFFHRSIVTSTVDIHRSACDVAKPACWCVSVSVGVCAGSLSVRSALRGVPMQHCCQLWTVAETRWA
jgi:hypothetical protein